MGPGYGLFKGIESLYNYMASHPLGELSGTFLSPGALVDTIVPEEAKPYIPGVSQAQKIEDSVRYWNDYERNTGKKRRYPGLQTHTPDISDPIQSAVNTLDWWL